MTSRSDAVTDPRRTTARVTLAIIAASLALFLLFSTGPGGAISFAQSTPTGTAPCFGHQIEWLNPSGHSSEISSEDQVGQPADSGRYHLVAWVTGLPTNHVVEFKYQVGTANEVTITREERR